MNEKFGSAGVGVAGFCNTFLSSSSTSFAGDESKRQFPIMETKLSFL